MTTVVPFPDPAAATVQRLATDPLSSAWVAASAGAGKTKVLTDRVLRLMLDGTPPERILCLTFTRAAAANMAVRVADALGRWAADDDERLADELAALIGRPPDAGTTARARLLFARVLDAPGGLNVATIHAFCQSLLGRFPVEAGVAPHFQTMGERDQAEMLKAAREEVVARARSDGPPAATLARALAEVTAHVDETGFAELMAALARERRRLARAAGPDPEAQARAALGRLLALAAEETPARVRADACLAEAVDALGLKLAVAALGEGSGRDAGNAAIIESWLDADTAGREASFGDYAAVFLTKTDPPTIRDRLFTKKVAEGAPGVATILEVEAERLQSASLKLRAARTREASLALLALGRALAEAYARHKRTLALVDYDDLIDETEALLERPGIAPWVLYKLDGGIDHVLIDEAQDTSAAQWRIVEALTAEYFAGVGTRDAPRTVFAVGDAKQSIFSFQGAEPGLFEAMRGRLAGRAHDAGAAWRSLDMIHSYRSTRAVLQAVDAVFQRPEAADGVASDGRPIRHQTVRDGNAGVVEVWPWVAPRAADEPAPWKPPVEKVAGDQPQARLARLVAGRIERMVAGREMLESQGRPIRAGDVMVLVRRRTAFVEELVKALKELAVEVAGVDRMVITEQMAVMDLIALGRFALLPGDDLTLACVLKGPLVGLSEDELFRLAYGRERSLWRSLGAKRGEDAAFAAAHDRLAEVLALADRAPPFEFYAHALMARDGRRKLCQRLGPEADDPIAEFLDLALAFERVHPPSLEGFLAWIESGRVEVKRDLEHEERDAVRVMTVHGAKGLQAPIVFLPDTLQVPQATPRLLWPQSESGGRLLLWPPSKAAVETVAEQELERVKALRDQEYRRLLYVAMTRAADRLYVCGWRGRNDPPAECWYNLIRDALAPIAEAAEEPFLAAAGETVGATVLRLVSPQRARPKEAAAGAGEQPFEPLPEWASQPPAPEPTPPRPLQPSRPADDEPPVRSPLAADGARRFQRGRLVHRLLQSLPELAPAAREKAARAWLAKPGHGLAPAAQDEIAAEVMAAIGHPETAALFGPGSLAEVPLAGLVGGFAVSGQVDRLLIEADRVLVVDYKTNRPPPAREDDVAPLYLKQMAAYRALLRRVFPDRTVRCLLLWTDGPRLMALGDSILDRHAPKAIASG